MAHSLLTELPVDERPRFHRDGLFWVAVAGGVLVAFGIGLWLHVNGSPTRSPWPWIVVSSVIVYPLLEELVFRGALQGWLLSHTWGGYSWLGITAANLVTTVAFTSLHLLHHPPLWAVSVAVPSLVFGFFRDRDGTIYPCIALHMLYNLLYLLAVVAS